MKSVLECPHWDVKTYDCNHKGGPIYCGKYNWDIPVDCPLKEEKMKELNELFQEVVGLDGWKKKILSLFESQKARYAADLADLSKENERLRKDKECPRCGDIMDSCHSCTCEGMIDLC